MTTRRDTSADDAAALDAEQAAYARGEHLPSVTLSGAQALVVRRALKSAFDVLGRSEAATKQPTLRAQQRDARAEVNHALTYMRVPDAEPNAGAGT